MVTVGRNNRGNLGFLGVDFQYKIIAAFLRDPNFFKDYSSIIDQNMFTEPHLKTVVGVLKDYYIKYDSVPDSSIILIKLRERSKCDDDIQYYTEVMEQLAKTSYAGYEEIEAIGERFFKQQNWIRVANHILRSVGDGDLERYDEIEAMINEAHSIGRHDHNVYQVFDNLDETLSEEAVTVIPTGINGLDDVLGGGLEKGKIGLIICPMGMGKTSMTTCISANAALTRDDHNGQQGYKVLQICFEDKARDLRRKYIAKLTQIEARELSKSAEIVEAIKARLTDAGDLRDKRDLISDNVRIEKLPTGEYSATKIRDRIRKHINEGFYPDLVIVDYFECVEPESGYSKSDVTEREGKTMRKFETMADELNIAMWIPSQGNRESITAELVTNDKTGGSIRKNQIAHVVLSIARPNPSDIENNKATIALLKNRSGLAGKVFNNVMFNNGTCTIQTDVNQVCFDNTLGFNDSGNSGVAPKTSKVQRVRESEKMIAAQMQREVEASRPSTEALPRREATTVTAVKQESSSSEDTADMWHSGEGTEGQTVGS